MKPLPNIMRKEIKEMLTPTTFIPIIILAIIFASMGNVIGGVQDQASQAPKIGLINMDGGEYGNVTTAVLDQNAEVVYNGTSVTDGLNAVQKVGGAALLVIQPNFSSNLSANAPGSIKIYWIMEGTGIMDTVSSSVVDALLNQVDHAISTKMIEDQISSDPAVVLAPTERSETTFFKGTTMENVSPATISGVMSSQSVVIPLAVMMIVIFSGGIVVSSMGMEKENKTLETLLTMPVRRSDIVLGKLGGAAVIGFIMAGIYMLGMGYYQSSLYGQSSLNMASFGLTLDLLDYILVGLSLFLAVFGALSLCMLLGSFARDYKSAQSLTMPVTFMAMVPMFVFMMMDFNTLPAVAQVALFAIPFSHPMMVMNNLMFNDYTLVLAGIAYEAVFAGVTVAASIWLFKKDLLITGKRKSTGKSMMGGWARKR
jgi:ABC-2 type transport system permease protein